LALILVHGIGLGEIGLRAVEDEDRETHVSIVHLWRVMISKSLE